MPENGTEPCNTLSGSGKAVVFGMGVPLPVSVIQIDTQAQRDQRPAFKETRDQQSLRVFWRDGFCAFTGVLGCLPRLHHHHLLLSVAVQDCQTAARIQRRQIRGGRSNPGIGTACSAL